MGTPTPPTTFAHLLQRCRRTVGLTQEELAERAHLSVRGISNLERGVRRLPQRGTVALLIEALGLQGVERAAFEAAARGLGEPGSAEQSAFPVPTNLPLTLTSFVGRERELMMVRHLLGETRLLTLTGAGGCGKTRLALEAAHALVYEPHQATAYADGIWLVELAPLGDGALIPKTLAAVLGVREKPGQLPLAGLTAFLCPKQVLLLLDNCEHLLEACAALADALLRVCPGITVLATSREALGISGERPWRVPSLGLPDPRARLTLEQAAACEAVRLFVQRAQAVRPDFALTGRQVILAAQVCRRLDGIPLAIELAAARLSALSLDHLSTRLDDRFRLLTGGSRTALPRQQTLRATLDWSYDLLGASERLLLRRLAVFADGWTLEAAEAVCADEGLAPEEILDLPAGLVNKSLVLLDEGRTGARYRLLETVRQYGREKLAAGEASQLQDRNLDWYLALAGQAARHIGGAEREMWLDRMEVELENMRAALRWSSLEDRQQPGLRLAAALEDFWYIRGYADEGRRWLEDLLEGAGAAVPTALRACALEVLALLTYYQGNCPQAAALHDESLAMFLELGDKHGIGHELAFLGNVARDQGAYGQAKRLYRVSLGPTRALMDKVGVSECSEGLVVVAVADGQPVRAARLIGAAHGLREATGTPLDLVNRTAHDRAVADVRTALGEEAFVAAWVAGQAMLLEETIEPALEEVTAE